MGVVFLQEEFYEEVLQLFDKALDIDNVCYNGLYGKMLVLYRMGKIKEKLVVLSQLRKLSSVF